MPPRSALLELATRRNSYICRSCRLASLGSSCPPAQSFARGYANSHRSQDGYKVKAAEPSSSRKTPKQDTHKGVVVKYFEKDPRTGQVTRLEDDDGEDEPDFEDLEELQASITAKMTRLEEALPKLERMTGVLERILEKHGPPGSIEALQEVLKTYDGPGSDISTDLPAIRFSEADHGKKQLQLRDNQASLLLQHLRAAVLALKHSKLQRKHIASAWKAFHPLLAVLAWPQTIVAKEVWDALWAVFSSEGSENFYRMPHVRMLAQVMTKAGVPMTSKQQLLAIEATFEAGFPDEALSTWRRLAPELGSKDSAVGIPYFELGVRMWSATGDIERAERTSRALLQRSSPATPADSRVLLHLIRAYCAKPATAERGFLLYRRMRDLAAKLEKPMDIEDYDEVIALFLSNGHTDFAMYAFTDMMFAGTVNLYGKSKLPNELRNSFFFGKWLKRLIGAGDLAGAYEVLTYMQKNGVMAASVQVNGFIGALLRTGDAANRQKAERLAWSMVRSRKNFVDLRKRHAMLEWPTKLVDGRPSRSDHEGPELDYTMVPRATVETFVILAENYRERSLFGRLEELFVAYQECAMGGDAMMMNELIASAVAQGRGDKARELYSLMVHEHDILPNADTFAILFRSLPVNQLPGPSLQPAVREQAARQARDVFRDMLASSWVFSGHYRARRGSLSENQVKLILHSFRKANDWPGLLAALQGLRDVLRFDISRALALEMLAEQERIDRPSPRMAKLVLRATMRLQERLQGLQQHGFLPADEPLEAVKDPRIMHHILVEHYYAKLQQIYPNDVAVVNELLATAKKEMGVSNSAKKAAWRRANEGQAGE